jgi:DNA polymerase I-like protein with 3'-5' exonuclease and polymerase domains
MTEIEDMLENAVRITKACREQRKAFTHWVEHNDTVENVLSFDTETTGLQFGMPYPLMLNPDKPASIIRVQDVTVFGISMAIRVNDRFVLLWGRLGTELYEECCKLLRIRGFKVAFNLRYDLKALARSGTIVAPIGNCSLTMARIYWNRRKKVALQKLAEIICPEISDWDDELKPTLRNLRNAYTRAGHPKGYVNHSFLPEDMMCEYTMTDSYVGWIVNYLIYEQVMDTQGEVYDREMKVLHLIKRMEDRGVPFNPRKAKRETIKLQRHVESLQSGMNKLAGVEFSAGSPKQVLQVIVQNVKVPEKLLMLKGKLTTEKDTLKAAGEKVKSPRQRKFISKLRDFRSCNKMMSSYLVPLRQRALINNNIVYGSINPADTRTSRMTVKDPALNTIPRPDTGFDEHNPVRACFKCRPGFHNYFFDYEQMEMWLFAIQAREKRMISHLMSGKDIHAAVCVDVYGKDAYNTDGEIIRTKRQKVKAVNFGIIYGMGIDALADEIDSSRGEAEEFKKEYFQTYPRIPEWLAELKHQLKTRGYVEDILGKRYHVSLREAYVAVNALVQGVCAQILKEALIQVYTRLDSFYDPRVQPILPLHDELEFEVPRLFSMDMRFRREFVKDMKKDMECIPQLMDMGYQLNVSAKMTTTHWEQKKNVKIIKLRPSRKLRVA